MATGLEVNVSTPQDASYDEQQNHPGKQKSNDKCYGVLRGTNARGIDDGADADDRAGREHIGKTFLGFRQRAIRNPNRDDTRAYKKYS